MSEQAPESGISMHAGFPNPAADSSLRSLDLNQLLIQHTASTYLFRIRGDDWTGLGIRDGDIAIVDRAPGARKSDLVIWWDENRGEFAISQCRNIPPAAQAWGVITATIHQFGKSTA